ncbi:MAG: hypothetical protein ABIK97_03935 [candidate division WOR-3 bacterium]
MLLGKGLSVVWNLSFFLILFLSCAKKALPPSPDRFGPRLLEIICPNRTQVILTFDEGIKEGKFLILSAKETIGIRSIKIKEKKVNIYTQPVKKENYLLIGEVADLFDNLKYLKVRFSGSAERETIKPEIRDISWVKDGLMVSFSEPMETTNFQFFTAPGKREDFSISWSEEKDKVMAKWSGIFNLPYLSFLILPSLTDLEGNHLRAGRVYQRFFDTLIVTKRQEGKVMEKEKGVGGAIIFLSDSFSFFALTDKDGNFKLDLPSGVYKLVGIYDEDGDGLVDFSLTTDLEVPAEPVFLRLLPEEKKMPISDYLR